MQITTKSKRENKLLDRTELDLEITYEGPTPSNEQIKQELAKNLKLNPELTIIKHIYGEFGTNKADVLALEYKTKEAMQTIEIIKEKKKEEKPKEEAPKEEAKEEKAEAKPEEKKEEAPKEEAKKEEKPAESKPETKE